MGFLESKKIPKVQDRIHYLKLTFVIAKKEQKLDNFYKLLNERHDSIKFIIKKENNNELYYLDVLLKRQNTEFLTTVFRRKLLLIII